MLAVKGCHLHGITMLHPNVTSTPWTSIWTQSRGRNCWFGLQYCKLFRISGFVTTLYRKLSWWVRQSTQLNQIFRIDYFSYIHVDPNGRCVFSRITYNILIAIKKSSVLDRWFFVGNKKLQNMFVQTCFSLFSFSSIFNSVGCRRPSKYNFV